MYFLIDMRPMVENWPEHGDFFSDDLLHALFRNHPSDVFLLWTTGETPLPESMYFDEYQNTRVIHTDITSDSIHWYTRWFSAIEVDDMVETQAMKEGMMPWAEKIGAILTCSPRPLLFQADCVMVQMVNHLSLLHFPEQYTALEKKYTQAKYYKKAFQKAHLVVVPSLFLLYECQTHCAVATEKLLPITRGIREDIIPPHAENPLWKDLPNEYFFVKTQSPSGALLALKSFELLKAKHPDLPWEMIIEENEKGALHMLYEHREKVHVLAPLENENHQYILSKASAFIDTSGYDPIGKDLLLAMRFEIPCIASTFGALPEISQGSTLMFDPTSATELYNAMENIITNASLRASLSEKAKNRSRDKQFFIDDRAIELINAIKDIKAS